MVLDVAAQSLEGLEDVHISPSFAISYEVDNVDVVSFELLYQSVAVVHVVWRFVSTSTNLLALVDR